MLKIENSFISDYDSVKYINFIFKPLIVYYKFTNSLANTLTEFISFIKIRKIGTSFYKDNIFLMDVKTRCKINFLFKDRKHDRIDVNDHRCKKINSTIL